MAETTHDLESVIVGVIGCVDLLLWNLIGEVIGQNHARVCRLVTDQSDLGGAAIEVANGFYGVDRCGAAADDKMPGHIHSTFLL